MNYYQATLVLGMVVAFGTGCAIEAEDGPLGSAEEAAIAPNAIAPNAIAPNAIAPNAIAPNAIAPNAIAPNALTPSAMAALQDPGTAGDLSRMWIHYAVTCALAPSQSFSYTWTDAQGTSHAVTETGSLAIAPGWATGPLDTVGQQRISACLGARTNYFGTSVLISMRDEEGPLSATTTASELSTYKYVEGAFWGNIFTSNPYLNACDVPADVAHSDATNRVCASGYTDPSTGATVPCGMIALAGACQNVCAGYDPNQHAFVGCLSHPGQRGSSRTDLAITTALP
jgi:hypothetical protein